MKHPITITNKKNKSIVAISFIAVAIILAAAISAAAGNLVTKDWRASFPERTSYGDAGTITVAKKWEDGLTDAAADQRPYPSLTIAGIDYKPEAQIVYFDQETEMLHIAGADDRGIIEYTVKKSQAEADTVIARVSVDITRELEASVPIEESGIYYLNVKDSSGQISSPRRTTINIIDNDPTARIETYTTAGGAVLSGTDDRGITAYYFGTKTSPQDSDFTSIESTKNFSTTVPVSTTGEYSLFTKDKRGHIARSNMRKIYTSLCDYSRAVNIGPWDSLQANWIIDSIVTETETQFIVREDLSVSVNRKASNPYHPYQITINAGSYGIGPSLSSGELQSFNSKTFPLAEEASSNRCLLATGEKLGTTRPLEGTCFVIEKNDSMQSLVLNGYISHVERTFGGSVQLEARNLRTGIMEEKSMPSYFSLSTPEFDIYPIGQ